MEEEEMLIELQKMKEQFSGVSRILLEYEGSGDSFGDFGSLDFMDMNNEVIIELPNTFTETYEKLIWDIINNSAANFNDDGCRGTITFDLEEFKISIDNYWYETISTPSGVQEWELVPPVKKLQMQHKEDCALYGTIDETDRICPYCAAILEEI